MFGHDEEERDHGGDYADDRDDSDFDEAYTDVFTRSQVCLKTAFDSLTNIVRLNFCNSRCFPIKQNSISNLA